MKKLLTIALLAVFAASLWAEVQFTPNGMAQYRLRLRMMSTKPDVGDATNAMNYRNQIAYYLGTGVKVNDVVSLGFQIGNDATSTEEVSFLEQRTTYNTGLTVPSWVSQAWAKMDAGVVNLTFGVLPVNGNGTLDLIERSLNTNSYAGASQVSWPVGTNASLEGIKVGAPILKDEFKLAVEVTHSVITNRTQAQAKDPKSNPPASMFIVNLPMSIQALTLNPEIVGILNRDANPITEKTDNEAALGLSGSYKINDMITVTAKGGYAMHKNTNSYIDGKTDTTFKIDSSKVPWKNVVAKLDTVDAAHFSYEGMLGGVGAVVAIGPGKLLLDLDASTNKEKISGLNKGTYIFVDVKYGFCMLEDAKKNITIMPRVRVFRSQVDKIGVMQEIRPELIFIGKF